MDSRKGSSLTFKQMLDGLGGVDTAKHLLEKPEIQEGLMRL